MVLAACAEPTVVDWCGEVRHYLPLIERVMTQTRRRVFDGEAVHRLRSVRSSLPGIACGGNQGLIAAAVSYRAVVTGPHIQREISRDTLRTSNKFIARRILVQVTRARVQGHGACADLTHKGFRQFVAGTI